jgi:hypothetical protein
MFRVSTVNLSADATQVDTTAGTEELGEMSAESVAAQLERFTALDPTQHPDADPHLLIVAPAGRFLVRTARGKLFLYNARATAESFAELTPAEIVSQLQRASSSPAGDREEIAAPAPTSSPRAAPHHGIAAAILFTGLALNGYTLYSVFYTASINEGPAVKLVTDTAELTTRLRTVVGTYATGDQAGDRAIVVQSDGNVRFFEIGSKNSIVNNTDTYRLGKHAEKFCLTTNDSGIVEIENIDTLVYYRDTYRRK